MTRRNILRNISTVAAALTVGSSANAQSLHTTEQEAGFVPGGVGNLAQLRNHQTMRSSSYDPSGGNADARPIEPGQTLTFLETQGPGMVTHIWITVSSMDNWAFEDTHFSGLLGRRDRAFSGGAVRRFFWTGIWRILPLYIALTEVASVKALNAYFPMPFQKSAKFTITNEGTKRTNSFYYNVDYYLTKKLPADMAYFHAQYRQRTPTKGTTNAWMSNGESSVLSRKIWMAPITMSSWKRRDADIS